MSAYKVWMKCNNFFYHHKSPFGVWMGWLDMVFYLNQVDTNESLSVAFVWTEFTLFWSCDVRNIPCFTFISFVSLYLWYDLFDLTSIKSIVCLKKNCLIWYDMLWFELWIPPFWSCDAHFIPQGIFWWISVAITVSIQKLFS